MNKNELKWRSATQYDVNGILDKKIIAICVSVFGLTWGFSKEKNEKKMIHMKSQINFKWGVLRVHSLLLLGPMETRK